MKNERVYLFECDVCKAIIFVEEHVIIKEIENPYEFVNNPNPHSIVYRRECPNPNHKDHLSPAYKTSLSQEQLDEAQNELFTFKEILDYDAAQSRYKQLNAKNMIKTQSYWIK